MQDASISVAFGHKKITCCKLDYKLLQYYRFCPEECFCIKLNWVCSNFWVFVTLKSMVFDFNLVMGLFFAVTEDVQEFKCQQVHQSSTHLTRSSVKQQEQSKIVSEQNHGLSQLKLQECSQFVTEETSGLISSLDTLEQWIWSCAGQGPKYRQYCKGEGNLKHPQTLNFFHDDFLSDLRLSIWTHSKCQDCNSTRWEKRGTVAVGHWRNIFGALVSIFLGRV